MPFRPSSSRSNAAPTRSERTSGSPHAAASLTTTPHGSCRESSAKTSAIAYRSTIALPRRGRAARRAGRRARRRAPRAARAPARRRRGARRAAGRPARRPRATSVSSPFSGASRATESTATSSGPRPASARSSSRRARQPVASAPNAVDVDRVGEDGDALRDRRRARASTRARACPTTSTSRGVAHDVAGRPPLDRAPPARRGRRARCSRRGARTGRGAARHHATAACDANVLQPETTTTSGRACPSAREDAERDRVVVAERRGTRPGTRAAARGRPRGAAARSPRCAAAPMRPRRARSGRARAAPRARSSIAVRYGVGSGKTIVRRTSTGASVRAGSHGAAAPARRAPPVPAAAGARSTGRVGSSRSARSRAAARSPLDAPRPGERPRGRPSRLVARRGARSKAATSRPRASAAARPVVVVRRAAPHRRARRARRRAASSSGASAAICRSATRRWHSRWSAAPSRRTPAPRACGRGRAPRRTLSPSATLEQSRPEVVVLALRERRVVAEAVLARAPPGRRATVGVEERRREQRRPAHGARAARASGAPCRGARRRRGRSSPCRRPRLRRLRVGARASLEPARQGDVVGVHARDVGPARARRARR